MMASAMTPQPMNDNCVPRRGFAFVFGVWSVSCEMFISSFSSFAPDFNSECLPRR
jgi:hypothetical protein